MNWGMGGSSQSTRGSRLRLRGRNQCQARRFGEAASTDRNGGLPSLAEPSWSRAAIAICVHRRLDFFYLDPILEPLGVLGFNDTGRPSIRRVMKFLRTHRHYEAIDTGIERRGLRAKERTWLRRVGSSNSLCGAKISTYESSIVGSRVGHSIDASGARDSTQLAREGQYSPSGCRATNLPPAPRAVRGPAGGSVRPANKYAGGNLERLRSNATRIGSEIGG
jgi:hypothetical protein